MKMLPTLSVAVALCWSLPALAACTEEDAVAKAEALAARVNQITESDPQKAKEINQELKWMRLARTAETLPNECAAYDRRMKELDQAAERAGFDSQ